MKSILLLTVFLSGNFAFAEGEGILRSMNNCMRNAYGEAEEYRCARGGYQAADRLLNLRYQVIIAGLDRKGVYLLRKAQHEWLNNGRNYECQANPDTGKTFQNFPIGAEEYKCFAKVTIERVNSLNDMNW